VADLSGTYELGPGDGRVLVKTGREGLAARVGHDLTLEITQWSAKVTVPAADDTSDATIVTADLDLGSLTVREGTGGAKPLSDKDRGDIQKQARKILGSSSSARFQSTRVFESASASGGGAVSGTLTLNGVTRPSRLTVTGEGPGKYRGSTSIKQSEFGITPYSGFFGALKLRDEVTVEFEVTLKDPPNGGG
jgi:polyisoprenoid-binding protein YceI